MSTIKLLTAFSSKTNQNFINMNYSIFKRPINFIIPSTHMLQSKDYNRGNSLQRRKLLFLKEMQIPNNLNASFKSSLSDKGDNCPESTPPSTPTPTPIPTSTSTSTHKEKLQDFKNQINITDAKDKGTSLVFKGIAYAIYAGEVVLASNEVKLLKQVALKIYFWAYNLFRVHILQNPNVKDALNDVRGDKGEDKPKKE